MAYASWCNNQVEAKYSSYECLVVVWVMTTFYCYLFGNPFTSIIDCQLLKWPIEASKLYTKNSCNILNLFTIKLIHN